MCPTESQRSVHEGGRRVSQIEGNVRISLGKEHTKNLRFKHEIV